MTWAEEGVRRRALLQRIADNGTAAQLDGWVETGKIHSDASRPPPQDEPEVRIARAQIEKDGRIIPENITKAIEQWQADKTSKPAEPT